jgi:hypothetical protein
MMDAYDTDVMVWLSEREAATSGYQSEIIEWELTHPRPLLSDYMKLQGAF